MSTRRPASAADAEGAAETKKIRVDVDSLISKTRACLKLNEELRIKHATQPLKFVISEEDLFLSIRALEVLGGCSAESLSEVSSLLLDLLDHENSDIVAVALDIISLLELANPPDLFIRLTELIETHFADNPTLTALTVRTLGNFSDEKFPITTLRCLLEISDSSVDAADLFSRVYSGESEITASLVSKISARPSPDLLTALAACSDVSGSLDVALSCLKMVDQLDVVEAALRVLAVIAASAPGLIQSTSPQLLVLLAVDSSTGQSPVIVELVLEILTQISDHSAIATSPHLADLLVHYATATEQISDLLALTSSPSPAALRAVGLVVAQFSARLILEILPISDHLASLLAQADITRDEVASFSLI